MAHKNGASLNDDARAGLGQSNPMDLDGISGTIFTFHDRCQFRHVRALEFLRIPFDTLSITDPNSQVAQQNGFGERASIIGEV